MASTRQTPPDDRRALFELALGAALILAGVVVLLTSSDDSVYVVGSGPLFAGAIVVLHGMSGLTGYKAFVAWRYLLVHDIRVTKLTRILIAIGIAFAAVTWMIPMEKGFDPKDPWHVVKYFTWLYLIGVVFWGVLRFSKPAMIVFLFGVGVTALSATGIQLVTTNNLPLLTFDKEQAITVSQVLGVVAIVGSVIAALALFFGCLRAFFTFFTTVPIGGVWIGTAALVCVLSVMSGFETDLRDKILGSNAHIQVTREDGEFVDWRDAKAKIDRIPGVVASTPYAVSEVVIAANNNGMNVIIKGIDPATVGRVTDLISDIDGDGPEAMQRLSPLIKDPHDRAVPQQPAKPGSVLDPAPDDMPRGGDPIDFSRTDSSPPPPPRSPPTGEPYGGDAAKLVEPPETTPPPVIDDPPPDDLLTSDAQPIDYSQPSRRGSPDDELEARVIDIPLEPSLSRRTQALPGVLVGKELVKQTHLFVGQEVRVVSPLSDPSNPDATGTPIPFNRDYRVAGTFYTGMYEYDLKYVYVSLESLQDFLDRGDAVDGIEIRVEDPDDTGSYVPTEGSAGKIREVLGPGYRIVDWRELNRSLFSALKLEKIAMFLVLGIVILVASFSIVGNLIMVVVEKAREIALLKTLGGSDVGVMQLFAIQGLLIGLIGTILGVSTGLAACWGGKRFGVNLNPDVYYIDKLPIHVDWQSVAAAGAAGVLISIAATLYPALLAARVRPAAGMRH